MFLHQSAVNIKLKKGRTIMPAGKITLLPHGSVPSSDESREKCYKLLVYCGADPQRYHDHRFTHLEQFIKFISRFDSLKYDRTPTLVALTQTCPLNSTVIGTRRILCARLPALANSLWIIYVDQTLDPGFVEAASRLGRLDAQLDNVPVFEDLDGHRYLVLTPRTEDYEYVRLRARLLATHSENSSRSRQDLQAVSVNGSKLYLGKP